LQQPQKADITVTPDSGKKDAGPPDRSKT